MPTRASRLKIVVLNICAEVRKAKSAYVPQARSVLGEPTQKSGAGAWIFNLIVDGPKNPLVTKWLAPSKEAEQGIYIGAPIPPHILCDL